MQADPLPAEPPGKPWFLLRFNQIQRGDLIISTLLLNFFLSLVWNLNAYPFKDVYWCPYAGFMMNLWFFFVQQSLVKLSQYLPREDAFNLGVVDRMQTLGGPWYFWEGSSHTYTCFTLSCKHNSRKFCARKTPASDINKMHTFGPLFS